MAGCQSCIDRVSDEYMNRYGTRDAEIGEPGAIEFNGSSVLWLLGGFALGCVATVIFVNISGETSFRGLAGKTAEYARTGYGKLDQAWGK